MKTRKRVKEEHHFASTHAAKRADPAAILGILRLAGETGCPPAPASMLLLLMFFAAVLSANGSGTPAVWPQPANFAVGACDSDPLSLAGARLVVTVESGDAESAATLVRAAFQAAEQEWGCQEGAAGGANGSTGAWATAAPRTSLVTSADLDAWGPAKLGEQVEPVLGALPNAWAPCPCLHGFSSWGGVRVQAHGMLFERTRLPSPCHHATTLRSQFAAGLHFTSNTVALPSLSCMSPPPLASHPAATLCLWAKCRAHSPCLHLISGLQRASLLHSGQR